MSFTEKYDFNEEDYNYLLNSQPKEETPSFHFDFSDDSLLGDSELTIPQLADKVKSVFENVVGKELVVKFTDSEQSWIDTDQTGNRVVMEIGTDSESAYTKFNQLLSHYAFDTLNPEWGRLLKPCLSEIPESQRDKALEFYVGALNELEDQRVESLMGKIYRGIDKRFVEDRKQNNVPESVNNPIDMLRCARHFKHDLIKDRDGVKASNCMEKVKFTDKMGTIVVGREFIETVLNPWIIANVKEEEQADEDGNVETVLKPTLEMSDQFVKEHQANRYVDHREFGDYAEDHEFENLKKELESTTDDELLKESKQNAKEKISVIKDEIEENARGSTSSVNPMSEHTGVIEHGRPEDYEIDKPLAKQLTKIFNKMLDENKAKIHPDGDILDIEEYIQAQSRGYGDVFKKEAKDISTEIVIGVDNSGSMNGDIGVARDMLSTLFKSVEKIRSINISAYTWSGSDEFCAITEINNMDDVPYCSTNNSYGGTPTDLGVYYGHDKLRSKRAKNKLFILLTDGYPSLSYTASESGINTCEVDKKFKKKLKSAKINDKINTMVVGLGCSEASFQDIFEDVACFNDIEDARDLIVKKFRTFITNNF